MWRRPGLSICQKNLLNGRSNNFFPYILTNNLIFNIKSTILNDLRYKLTSLYIREIYMHSVNMNLSKDIDLGDKRSNENIYNSSKILKIKDKMMLALSNKESNKKKEYKSTADLRREKLASYTAWSFVIIGLGGACYMGRKWTDDEIKQSLDVKDKFSSTFFGRLKQRTSSLFNYYNEPAFDKLLPDPLPELYQRRFTLVLDLDDLLIHSEWSREHGWRIAKRPGLDYFLSYLSQYYEIVIFTTQYAATAIPIIQKLDPYRSSLSASLFREATRYVNGKLIKVKFKMG